ncbi:MAG: peptidoglycan binding domain-containing protein, partial [Lachnospiraceae bacterium]|nr:peptidoglycan binding domain-containing protein [Lachnospiraceae bacterium]
MANENITDEKAVPVNKKKIAIIVLVIILAVYIIGVIFFHNRYLFGTKIGDKKISGKTSDQVEAMLSDDAKNYDLTLTGRKSFTDHIKGEDIDLRITLGDNLQKGMESQNSLLWFLGASKDTRNLMADVSYDSKKFKNAVDSLSCFDKENIIAPENAKIVLNDKDKFVIKEEIYGTTVKKKVLTQKIQECLTNVDTELSLKSAKCYKDPTLLKDDKRLEDGIEQANKLADVSITYDLIIRR